MTDSILIGTVTTIASFVVTFLVGRYHGTNVERRLWNEDFDLPANGTHLTAFVVQLQFFEDAFPTGPVPHRYLYARAHEKAGKTADNRAEDIQLSGERWPVSVFLEDAPKKRRQGRVRGTLAFEDETSALQALRKLPETFTLSRDGWPLAICRIVRPPIRLRLRSLSLIEEQAEAT